METNELETAQLTFINQPHLDKCVAAGKSYQIEDKIFILFVLAEDDGCTICYGVGNENNNPIGESFTRFMWFDSLDKALEIYEKCDALTIKTLST